MNPKLIKHPKLINTLYSLNSLISLNTPFLALQRNFLSEWRGSGASQKNPPRDSTLMYSPGWVTFREVPLTRHYHKKFDLSSEDCRYNAQQKCRRWVVLGVRPIDGNFC